MSVDTLTITDSTTREELIAHVNDLEEEIHELETTITALRSEIEELRLAPEQRLRLEESADLMAEQGRIHNTPHAKRQWIDGK